MSKSTYIVCRILTIGTDELEITEEQHFTNFAAARAALHRRSGDHYSLGDYYSLLRETTDQVVVYVGY